MTHEDKSPDMSQNGNFALNLINILWDGATLLYLSKCPKIKEKGKKEKSTT